MARYRAFDEGWFFKIKRGFLVGTIAFYKAFVESYIDFKSYFFASDRFSILLSVNILPGPFTAKILVIYFVSNFLDTLFKPTPLIMI